MSVQAVIGAQWGDEGKGKFIDIQSENADVVARYQGGANAGHTICVEGEETILHQLPSGIIRDNRECILGNGMVIDPIGVVDEINTLSSKGVKNLEDRIHISQQAHIVTPIHKILDAAYERQRGENAIGTTKKGIGPCYTDKIKREGIRASDLKNYPQVEEKLNQDIALYRKQGILEDQDLDDIFAQLQKFKNCAQKITDYVDDTINFIHDSISEGKEILIEGAQGTMLDVDLGSYSYVTSSNTTAGNVMSGLGINPFQISKNYGILKAYLTRVGKGPFPTELRGEIGDFLREKGNEFGATTNRKRRCGWLDLELADYAYKVNGFTSIVITKLDILDEMDEIKVCTGYKEGRYPKVNLGEVTPEYKTFPGWEDSVTGVSEYKNLPQNAKNYLDFIQNYLGVTISHISVGKDRSEIIEVD